MDYKSKIYSNMEAENLSKNRYFDLPQEFKNFLIKLTMKKNQETEMLWNEKISRSVRKYWAEKYLESQRGL